jgi:hypothetical protein
MEHRISEADWKLFRKVKPLALERFCQRVLSEIVGIASDSTKGSHERYLNVFKQLQARDDELAAAFNDSRRSTAFVQLSRVRSLGLLTDEEIAEFSAESRGVMALYLEMWKN